MKAAARPLSRLRERVGVRGSRRLESPAPYPHPALRATSREREKGCLPRFFKYVSVDGASVCEGRLTPRQMHRQAAETSDDGAGEKAQFECGHRARRSLPRRHELVDLP